MRATHRLYNPHSAYKLWCALWTDIKTALLAGQRLEVEIREERRNLDQNARMWAMLGEVSRQVDWHGQKLEPGEWKDIFSASLKRQKAVPGLDGGFVILGSSTSRMTKSEMSDLMELMAAFGAGHDVEFSNAVEEQA